MSNFAAERIVTARKPHTCGECWRGIQPGESYQRAAGQWWRKFWHMTTCAHCAAARPLLLAYDPDYRDDYYGGLREGLEAHRYDLPAPLLRVLVGARRRWTRRDGGLMEVPQ